MRKLTSEAFLVAFALLISTTAASAYAQDFDPGMMGMEEISGTYTNEEAGVTITFPDGWSGLGLDFGGATFASVAPGGMTGEEEPTKMIALIAADKTEMDEAPTDPSDFSGSEEEPECDTPTPTETTVSGKRGYEMTMECTVEGEQMKMKITAAESANYWVGVMYMSPTAEFDADVGKYDAAVDTLQIQGAVDASMPELPTTGGTDDGGASTDDDGGEMQSTTMPVTVGEDSIGVSVESLSTISALTLDEDSKTLSFSTDGNGDRTVIAVGSVLEGPYTVMVDGEATDDFEETTDADGVKTVSVPHASGAHEVMISGTQVVPEFPIAMLGIVAALIATVSVIGRTRFSSKGRTF